MVVVRVGVCVRCGMQMGRCSVDMLGHKVSMRMGIVKRMERLITGSLLLGVVGVGHGIGRPEQMNGSSHVSKRS